MASGSGAVYLQTAGESAVQRWQGMYYGYISVNQDPLDIGRVKLRVPQVFGNTTSGWAAPMVPVTFIPKVGTAVTVMFVGGDPTQPVWFGNFAVPGGSGTSVTTGTAAPPSSPSPVPVVGSIYYQVDGSNAILGQFEWNGAGWVEYRVGGSYIAPGTIVPGIINGTVVNAATLENSSSDPKTSINPDGSIKITNSSGKVIYEISPAGVETWFDASGNTLMQQSPSGVLSIQDPASIQFPSGQTWEESPPASINTAVAGTSPAQYIQMTLIGPATTTTGAHDRVVVGLNSAAENNSSSANLEFLYQGSNGTYHEQAYLDITGFNILAGSIVAVDPGSSPATPATWHTISLQNGYTAGANPGGFSDVPQIRLMADNKTLMFKGTLSTPSSPSSGVWGTLPSGFPNANLGGNFGVGLVANYSGGTVDHIQVQNNSNLSLNNYSAHGGINFNITCIVPTQ